MKPIKTYDTRLEAETASVPPGIATTLAILAAS
jgi:hypothetical protein